MKCLLQYLIPGLLTLSVWAGELKEPDEIYDRYTKSFSNDESYTSFGQKIEFAEPVADEQEQRRDNRNAPGEESNLFEVTGDGPLPMLKWESSGTLLIMYRKGTLPLTRYKLSFRPGHRKYLSGNAMKNAEIEFCSPACMLEESYEHKQVLIGGEKNGAVLLTPKCEFYNAATPDAVKSMRFEFLLHKSRQRVRGVAQPARVCDLRPLVLREVYAKATLDTLAALTPETVVPGFIMVRPERPIAGEWSLFGSDDEERYQLELNSCAGFFDTELKAELRSALARFEGREQLCLGLLFNAPLAEADVPALFRALELRCGDAVAENVPGQLAKKMMLNGQEITFTLHTESPYSAPQPEQRVSFPAPWTERLVVRVDGLTHLPQPITATVPAGTRALKGLQMKQPQVCHGVIQVLEPALPVMLPSWKAEEPLTVPFVGDHKFATKCIGCEQVIARLACVPYEHYHAVRRHLPVSDEEEERAMLALLKDSFGPEKAYALQPNGLRPVPYCVDLDDLSTTPLRAGMYLLHLRAVHHAPDDTNTYPHYHDDVYYLVHLTDLAVSVGRHAVVAHHLSDGRLVEEAQVRVFMRNGDSYDEDADVWTEQMSGTLRQGVIGFPFDEEGKERRVLVMNGDDFSEAHLDSSWNMSMCDDEQCSFSNMLTDRQVYRPGEIVHLFGTVRTVRTDGSLQLLPLKEVTIASNPQMFPDFVVPVNEYGVFHADVTLPTDTDEAEQFMRIFVKDGDEVLTSTPIIIQDVERKSFKVSAGVDIPGVNAEHATVYVEAKDFNGTPVNGTATIQLVLSSWSKDNKAPVQVALNKEGKASHVFRLADFSGMDKTKQNVFYANVKVTNEREETESIYGIHKTWSPAGVSLHYNEGHLLCADSASGTPPDHEQAVQWQVSIPVYVTKKLPNGILVTGKKDTCIHQSVLRVPPHSQEGIAVPWREIVEEFRRSHPEYIQIGRGVKLEFSAADADGRRVRLTAEEFIPEDSRSMSLSSSTVTDITTDGKQLFLPIRKEPAELYLVVLRSKHGIRTVMLKPQVGETAMAVALQSKETACMVNVLVIPLKKNEQGVYTPVYMEDTRICIPPREEKLAVELHTPEQTVLPGSTVSISGCVQRADGSPAAHAAVCLYAVDKGMLDKYRPTPYSYTLAAVCNVVSYTGLFDDVAFNSIASPQILTLRHRLCGKMPYHDVSMLRYGDEDGFCSYSISWHKEYGMVTLLQPQHLWPDSSKGFSGNGDLPPGANEWEMEGACFGAGGSGLGAADDAWHAESDEYEPYLRTDFTPTPIWLPTVQTDENGRFQADATVVDTLTSYVVYAVAVSADGNGCGVAESEFTVNQPLMLTAGTPLGMCVGDSLCLPLTVSNRTEQSGVWAVSMPGEDTPQQVALQAGQSAVLYSTVHAEAEGEQTLRWQAVGTHGGDAVESRVNVRFPAPMLREIHHARLQPGDTLSPAAMVSAELRGGKVEAVVSANPLQYLSPYIEAACEYRHGSTEQRASGLLPWLLYDALAPLHPAVGELSPADAALRVQKGIEELFERQNEDGGLSTWADDNSSSFWVSAHAAMVFSMAQELGYTLPQEPWAALCRYLQHKWDAENRQHCSPALHYAVGRALGNTAMQESALRSAVGQKRYESNAFKTPYSACVAESMRTLHALQNPQLEPTAEWQKRLQTLSAYTGCHSAQDTAWVFVAVQEYLRRVPQQPYHAELTMANGRILSVGLHPVAVDSDSLCCTQGCAYVTVRACAVPRKLPATAVSDKGLHVTRTYEKRAANGTWVPATEFCVGDAVRITVQCVALHPGAQYMLVEDYPPACLKMQDADSYAELGDRVSEHFELPGQDVVTLQYHARAVFSGTATAPPASAQLLYEPQVHGLSAPQQIKVTPAPACSN